MKYWCKSKIPIAHIVRYWKAPRHMKFNVQFDLSRNIDYAHLTRLWHVNGETIEHFFASFFLPPQLDAIARWLGLANAEWFIRGRGWNSRVLIFWGPWNARAIQLPINQACRRDIEKVQLGQFLMPHGGWNGIADAHTNLWLIRWGPGLWAICATCFISIQTKHQLQMIF